jgi:hypothetical protein
MANKLLRACDTFSIALVVYASGGLRAVRKLVCRLTYNDDVAAGQLAVFQGASDEHPPRRT